jgi:hypothetical protein
MPRRAWSWLPIDLPVADLPRIVSEMCGLRLEETPGGDLTCAWPDYWPEYSDESVVCRVLSTWSAGSCTVTLREDCHFSSERGEPPSPQCINRARVDLPMDMTLFVAEPAYYHLEGPPAAVHAIETQWLAILKRDYFRPTWLDHPLVPDEWRLQARDASIAPAEDRLTPGRGGWPYSPAVLLASNGARCFGLLVDGTEALPLGPLPPELDVVLLECRRPAGQSELKVPETFMRLFAATGSVTETTRSNARLQAPIGFLTMHDGAGLQDVMFSSWRADNWILRSQFSYPWRSVPATLSGDFDHQWAIQNEDGGPWAIFAQRTRGLFSPEEHLDVCVVGEASPASAIAERLISILAADGWRGGPPWRSR